MQTGPLPAEDLQVPGRHALSDLEAHARLHRRDQTHDALGYPVLRRDVLGQVVFVESGTVAGLVMIEGDHRPPSFPSQSPAVVGDPSGGGLGVRREVLEPDTLGPQIAPSPVLLIQGAQMPLEDKPVVHRQTPGDPPGMNFFERSHRLHLSFQSRPPRAPPSLERTGPALPARQPVRPEHGRVKPQASAARPTTVDEPAPGPLVAAEGCARWRAGRNVLGGQYGAAAGWGSPRGERRPVAMRCLWHGVFSRSTALRCDIRARLRWQAIDSLTGIG